MEPSDSPIPSPHFTECDFGFYAHSDDLASLRRSHPLNVHLHDQGLGSVPNVLEIDPEGRTATLSAATLHADIHVALGWHVHDEGTRILVQDPAQKIKISLHLLFRPLQTIDQLLDDLQTQTAQAHANPEFKRFAEQGISVLMVRNINDNHQPIEHVHLLTSWARGSSILRAQVTVDASSRQYAVNHACLILKTAIYRRPPRKNKPVPPGGPPWWSRAQWLEAQDRLQEAEQTIRNGIPAIPCAIQIAEMYRLRWIRLQHSDPATARQARQQAAEWACTYAGWATSGGEGVALSRERDEFIRQLGPDPLD